MDDRRSGADSPFREFTGDTFVVETERAVPHSEPGYVVIRCRESGAGLNCYLDQAIELQGLLGLAVAALQGRQGGHGPAGPAGQGGEG